MADISLLLRLVNGIIRNVDISSNTLVTTSIKVGGGVSNTELTKAILDKLVNLQTGGFEAPAASYHIHDGRYYTEAELASASGSSGSDLIGDDATYSNFTPAAATVKGALSGIDSALSAAGGRVKVSAADTTADYLNPSLLVDNGSNSTDPLEKSIQNPGADETLRIRFDQSKVDHGSLAGLADDDHPQYLKTDGSRTLTGNQSAGGFKITNAANGTANQDYVTKAQLDSVSAGLDPKASVRAATTVALPAATYDNGTGGVGATLEGDLFAELPVIDGITLIVGNRLLVKNQADPIENGIYVVTDLGDGLAQGFILTRATDQDGSPTAEVSGGNFTFVEAGTTQEGSGWSVVWDGEIVVGTDDMVWSQFSSFTFIGGDMVTITGNTISVDLLTNGGLKSSNPGNVAGELQVSLEATDPTLEVNGSNELKVKYGAGSALTQGASGLAVLVDNSTIEISTSIRIKDAGVTLAKLASNSVDENKIVSTTFSATGALDGGSGTKVSVRVDDVSIEKSSNNLRVKSGAYDQATITGGSGSAAAVQYAPANKKAGIAGESFAADTSFAVRMAVSGETAGRWYKADYDASVSDKFYAYGMIEGNGAAAKTAGDPIIVVMMGTITLGSSDSAFAAGEIGQAVHVKAAGAWDAVSQITYATDQASYRVGMVQEVDKVLVGNMQLLGIQ